MTNTTHPDKQAVRDWICERTQDESPPPTMEDIRRALGWRLLPNNGPAPEVRD